MAVRLLVDLWWPCSAPPDLQVDMLSIGWVRIQYWCSSLHVFTLPLVSYGRIFYLYCLHNTCVFKGAGVCNAPKELYSST